MKALLRSAFTCLLALVALAIPSPGQTTSGAIGGTITDSSGAVVPGASITVRNVETGVARTLTTNTSGYYRAPELGLGKYEVSVQAGGFQGALRAGIEITVGREAIVDFALKVGSVSEQVTVTGEAPLIQSTNATVASLISERTLREIPLNGRNFTDLASLQPGVISNLGMSTGVYQGSTGRIVVNGSRPQQSLYLLDGIEISYLYTNTPPGSVLGKTLGVDTIQEFSLLQSNYGAQYGRAVGGIVNAVTRSGTNRIHGTLFEFFRNSAVDARNFFDRPAPAPVPPFKQNQFGGSAGGPVVKDKLFFFGSYEGLHQRIGTSDVGFTLSPEAQRGEITGCPAPLRNCSPSQRIVTRVVDVNPDTRVLFRILPPANGGDFHQMGDYYNQGLQQFVGSRTSSGSENYYMGRADFHPNSNNNIFGRVVLDRSITALPDTQLYPDGSGRHTTVNAKGDYQFDQFTWTRIVSSTFLSSLRVGFTRNNNYQCQCLEGTSGGFGVKELDLVLDADKLPPIPRQFSIVPGIPFGGRLGIPGLFLPGGHNGPGNSEVGGSLNDPLRLTDNTYTVDESITWTRGRHTLVLGGDFRRYQENALQGIWASGNISWASIQNFLSAGTCTGAPACTGFPGINSITTTGVTGPPDGYRGYRQSYGSLYFQDDFRMSAKLTLNLGMRWERITGPSEVNGKAAHFRDIVKDADWTQLGHEPLFAAPSGFWNGFTPRLGVAYSLNEKTSVRAGVGVFQEMPLQYAWSLTPFYPPYSDRLNVRNATQWPNPLTGVNPRAPAVLAARQPITVDPHLKNPYAMQYNLSVERQWGSNWVTSVAYVGTRGVSLFNVSNVLQPQPQLDGAGALFTPRGAPSINPALDSTRYYSNFGDSRYNALQLRAEKRFSNGLQFSASHTWSNNIAIGSFGLDGGQVPSAAGTTGWLIANAWDYRHYDKGPAQQDVRHNFIFNYNYELPFGNGKWVGGNATGVANALVSGWQINGVISARTGLPVPISGGGYNPVQFCNTCLVRPNLKPGASNNPRLGDPSLYFDPSVFTVVTPGYFGNLGHNTLTGPKLVNMDFSVFKRVKLREALRLQIRAEAFNLLNHPNFRAPSPVVFNADGTLNPTAGQITLTSSTSRQLQFALKLEF